MIKKIKRYIAKIDWWVFGIITASLLLLSKTFQIKFSWIDDGWNIVVARDLFRNLTHLNLNGVFGGLVESSIGRFRPVYWVWQVVVYLIGGQQSSVHYLLHAFLIVSILILVYKIILLVSNSKQVSALGSFLVLLFPLNFENWIRLGPQEPLMILFILISVYSLLKNDDYKKPVFFIVLALLTKETAVAVIPCLIVYSCFTYIINRKDLKLVKITALTIFVGLISVLINSFNRKGYSSYYSFNLLTAKYNFILYLNMLIRAFPVIWLFLTTLIFRNLRPVVNFKFTSIKLYEVRKIFFLILSLMFVAIQSPWAWVLDRYMLPSIVFGIIFVCLELNSILVFLDNQRKIKILAIIIGSIYLLQFGIVSIFKLNESITRQLHMTNNIYNMIKRISETTPNNGRLYLNFIDNDATYELLFETKIHLDLFFDRQDIVANYIEYKDVNNDYIVLSGSPLGNFPFTTDDKLSATKRIKNMESYTSIDKFMVLNNPETIARQMVKKIIRLIRNGENVNSDGLYTDYLLKDNWRIYYY